MLKGFLLVFVGAAIIVSIMLPPFFWQFSHLILAGAAFLLSILLVVGITGLRIYVSSSKDLFYYQGMLYAMIAKSLFLFFVCISLILAYYLKLPIFSFSIIIGFYLLFSFLQTTSHLIWAFQKRIAGLLIPAFIPFVTFFALIISEFPAHNKITAVLNGLYYSSLGIFLILYNKRKEGPQPYLQKK